MSKSLDSFEHEEKRREHIEALQQLVDRMYEEMKPGGNGGNDYHDAWQVFGEQLTDLSEHTK